jgi:hypothetical protein
MIASACSNLRPSRAFSRLACTSSAAKGLCAADLAAWPASAHQEHRCRAAGRQSVSVGATAIVVLTACFPQDRIAFLGLLALWGGLCAFVATALRNFASYSAALAGYTAAIIAADNLGATGGVR